MAEDTATGRVAALLANFCWVELDSPGPGAITRLLCTRRTRLGKRGVQICSGDRVRVEAIDWAAARAAVVALLPRSTLLARPAVANLTRVVVVAALAEPEPDPLQLTRFLIAAEATGQAVDLVFSKADRLDGAAVAAWRERVQAWGYEPIAVSIPGGHGLEELRARLSRPGLAVLCGPSGVGKSSLLNALRPELELRIGAVSGRLQRGRHTTRHVELFALAPGALVADSPGFNRPLLPGDPAGLARLFPELRDRLDRRSCQFRDCLHLGDPGCAIEPGWPRESFYRQCLAALAAGSDGGQSRCAPGRRLEDGRQETRLDPRLRRGSRRRRRQGAEAAEPLEGISSPDREG
jgi:ribosome biogenesis GTPase